MTRPTDLDDELTTRVDVALEEGWSFEQTFDALFFAQQHLLVLARNAGRDPDALSTRAVHLNQDFCVETVV